MIWGESTVTEVLHGLSFGISMGSFFQTNPTSAERLYAEVLALALEGVESRPDGVIMDFEFLPDGRLVVVGSFTRLDNPGGHRYHDVNGLGIYDPKEPTANKWKPLGTVQYNGTVSAGGTIYSVEYDPQGDHLYVGGTFGGIPNKGQENKSPFVHRYDFKTKSWEPMKPGVNGSKPVVYRIFADTSTKPSTIYVG